jgi:magnesium transporter
MLAAIRPLLDGSDLTAAKDQLSIASPDQIAELLPRLTDAEQAVMFRLLAKDTALYVFELLDPRQQMVLVEALTTSEAAELLEALDADDRVRLVDELPAKVATRLVAAMSPDTVRSVTTMLNYPPDSVGRILSPAYLAVRDAATAAEALAAVRGSELRHEHLETVFVIDSSRRYRGLIRLANLLRADPDQTVATLVEAADVAARAADDAARAARRLQRRDLDALPVLDGEGRLIGAVTVDDAMDAIDEDTTATMFAKAGIAEATHATEVVRSEKLTSGSILYPVRVRIAFLIVTLLGGLAVGGLIDRFEDTLAAVVALAIFIPLVMDMGGNVGTQSTTIFARGLALGQIDLDRIRTHIWREMRVGLVMGSILGLAGGSIAFVWQGAPNDIPQLGIAVGVSLFVSVNLACFLGFLLPYVMVRIGLDHAPGADPFITTIKDFTGLLVYFGLATYVLGLTG